MPAQNIIHADHNVSGNTFIVGDIHGHYDELGDLLEFVNFNFQHDILYATGDLVDRGKFSVNCLELIHEPWFRSVWGNHEESMKLALVSGDKYAKDAWYTIGGEWSISQDTDYLRVLIRDASNKMPLVYAVGDDDRRFNIAHAELTCYNVVMTDQLLDSPNNPLWDYDTVIWSRALYKNRLSSFAKTHYSTRMQSTDLSITYVGHTSPVYCTNIGDQQELDSLSRLPIQIERQVYIDGGISNGVGLTMVNPYDDVIFNLNAKTGQIDTYELQHIPKYLQYK